METTRDLLAPPLPKEIKPRYSLFQHDREKGLWPRSLRIAAAQVTPAWGDLAANVAKVIEMLERTRADGIQLVVFPEQFLSGCAPGLMRPNPSAVAIPYNDVRLEPIAEACRRNEVAAIVGAVTVEDARLYVSTLAFNASGEVMATYHKQHLAEDERGLYEPGEIGRTLSWSQWDPGLGLGQDSVLPAHAEGVASMGCHVYLVGAGEPASSGLLSARARDNGMYVLMACSPGTAAGPDAGGGSAIWDPSGALVAQACAQTEDLVAVTLDFSTLPQARQRPMTSQEYTARRRQWPRFDGVNFEPMAEGRVFLPLHNAAVPLWEIEADQAARAAASIAYPALSKDEEAECNRLFDLIVAGDIDALEHEAATNDAFPDGIDASSCTDRRWISHAVDCAPIEVVAWMISKKVDVSFVDGEGYTLLFCALDLEGPDKYPKLELLLRSGAPTDLHGTNDWTAVHMAACRNDVEGLRLLRKYGADLRAISVDFSTSTPVEDARTCQSWEALAFLEQAIAEDAGTR